MNHMTKTESLYGSSLNYTLSSDKFGERVEEPDPFETKCPVLKAAKYIALTFVIIMGVCSDIIKNNLKKWDVMVKTESRTYWQNLEVKEHMLVGLMILMSGFVVGYEIVKELLKDKRKW